jgi:hypothetical protein
MKYLAVSLYIIGPLSVGVLQVLLMILGKRLGQALELPPYYRLYYVSLFFFLIPLPVALTLLLTKAWGLPDPSQNVGIIMKLAVASIPLTIGITLAIIATAKYWGWIWGELSGPRGEEGGRDEA